ncbi:SCO2400 family protein [Streptomyces sp. NRRL S-146]|uniref:SCO2400 family protein n=1 Tax=Streptomyces sp. NRRL S-146 TaxID=1463884 RepID=UPI003B632C7B
MDYCDPCRRHLNGALACPGCGTPAETLRRRGQEYGGYGATAAGHPGAEPERPTGADGPPGPAGPCSWRPGSCWRPVVSVSRNSVWTPPVRRRNRPRPGASRRTGTPRWRRGRRAAARTERHQGLTTRQRPPRPAHLMGRPPRNPRRRRSRSPRRVTNRRRALSRRRREAPPAARRPTPRPPRPPRSRPRPRARPRRPRNRNRPRPSRASGSCGGAPRAGPADFAQLTGAGLLLPSPGNTSPGERRVRGIRNRAGVPNARTR